MTPTAEVEAAMAEAREQWDTHRKTIDAIINLYGISRKQLASRMGLGAMTLSNRLNGLKPIDPWELAGFAVALEVPREVLDMQPSEAMHWVIEHRPANLRNRCYATSPLVGPLAA